MVTTQALNQRRAALVAEAESIYAAAQSAGGDPNAEQQAKLVDLKAKLEANKFDQEFHADFLEKERNAPAVSSISGVNDLAGLKAWGADWGADKILADKSAKSEQREWARNVALGEQCVAIFKAAGRGIVDPRLLAAAPGRGLNETIGPDGGYLVATDVLQELQATLNSGQILSRVNRLSLSSDANSLRVNYIVNNSEVAGSHFGGVQGYWLEEGAQKTATKPQFDFLMLTLHKIAALAVATDEVLQDVSILGSMIFSMMSQELLWDVEAAVWGGNGAGKPLGFATAGNPSLVTVTAKAGAPAARVQFEDIAGMWMRLSPASQSKAVWFVNADVQFALSTMSFTVGAIAIPVLMPAGGISGLPYSTIYGRPVIVVPYASTLGTTFDIVLADLSQYYYLQKGGIQTDSSIHLYFDWDETAFRAVLRCDGRPAWKTVFTPAVGSNTTSPFVALSTRS